MAAKLKKGQLKPGRPEKMGQKSKGIFVPTKDQKEANLFLDVLPPAYSLKAVMHTQITTLDTHLCPCTSFLYMYLIYVHVLLKLSHFNPRLCREGFIFLPCNN